MIKPAALLMAGVMAAVTAGTYYGLDLLPREFLTGPFGRAAAPEPKPAAPAPAAEAVASASPAPAPAAAPAQQPAAPTEQELAEEPPPKPAATPAPAESKAEPAPAAAPPPEPEPAAKPEPPAPKAAPKPAPSKPTTVASATKPSEPAETAAPAKAKPTEADGIKPWWPDASKMPDNQLKLVYAGQVKGEPAVALLFSAPLSLDTVKQHAQIKAEDGGAASGEWELGKNPRLAVFRGLQPGRYTVILQPEIADDKGFMLGTTLKGPVYVQASESP